MADKLPDVPAYLVAPMGEAAPVNTGFWTNAGAGFEEGLRNTSVGLISRLDTGYGQPLTEDQFNKQYEGTGLKYSPGLTAEDASAAYDAGIYNRQLDDIRSRSTIMGSVGFLGGSFAGAALDPINLLPFGEGLKAATLGESILKGALENVAQEALIGSPLSYALSKKEQTEFGVIDFATNLAFAGSVGGAFGALGHGWRRLVERGRSFGVGQDISGNPTNPSDLHLPQDNPTTPAGPGLSAVTDEMLVKRALGQDSSPVENTAGVEGTGTQAAQPTIKSESPGPVEIHEPTTQREADAKAALAPQNEAKAPIKHDSRTDAEILAATAGTDAGKREGIVNEHVVPRDAVIERGEDGTRTVVDPNSGEILFDEGKNHEALSRIVSPENKDIRDQAEALFRDKMFGQDAATNINRENALGGMLRQRADADAKVSEEGPRDGTPPKFGVLELRQSEGNRLKTKEVSVQKFWQNTRRAATTIGRGTRDDIGRIGYERMQRLTLDQFDYTVDHVATTRELQKIAEVNGIATNADATKREIGDLIYRDMHGNERPPVHPVIAKAREDIVAQVKDRMEAQQEAVLNDLLKKERELIEKGGSPEDIHETELGVDEVETGDDAIKLIEDSSVSVPLDELTKTNRDVAQVVADIRKLKDKKSAIKQALVCLLGGSE